MFFRHPHTILATGSGMDIVAGLDKEPLEQLMPKQIIVYNKYFPGHNPPPNYANQPLLNPPVAYNIMAELSIVVNPYGIY